MEGCLGIKWQVEIDRDMATNLYAGAAASTNNFTSYSTNADTFEHIATLLRLGAVKKTFKIGLLTLQNFELSLGSKVCLG